MIQAKFCSWQTRFYDREIDAASLYKKRTSKARNQTSCLIHLQHGGFGARPFHPITHKLDDTSEVLNKDHIQQSTKTCFYTVTPLWRLL